MHKTVIIHIAGQLIHADESAYQMLKHYLDALYEAFVDNEDGDEIVQDIEIRIAELLLACLGTSKQIINENDMKEVLQTIGDIEGTRLEADREEELEDASGKRKLYRLPDRGMIGGVCSGIAVRLGAPPTLMRLVFTALIPVFGFGALLYLILWAAVPAAVTRVQKMESRGQTVNLDNLSRVHRVGRAGEQGHRWRIWEIVLFFPFFVVGKILRGVKPAFLFLFRVLQPVAFLAVFVGLIALLVLLRTAFEDNLYHWPQQFLFHSSTLVLWGVVMMGFVTLVLQRYGIIHRPTRPFWHGMLIVGVMSIWSVAYYGIRLGIEHSEHATTSTRVELPTDARNLVVTFGDPLSDQGRNVSVDFYTTSGVSEPYMTITSRAFGRSQRDAWENMQDADYDYILLDSVLVLDQHLTMSEDALSRDQSVAVSVYIPEGQTLILDHFNYQWGFTFHSSDNRRWSWYGNHTWRQNPQGPTPMHMAVLEDGFFVLDRQFKNTFDYGERKQLRDLAGRFRRNTYTQHNQEPTLFDLISNRMQRLRDSDPAYLKDVEELVEWLRSVDESESDKLLQHDHEGRSAETYITALEELVERKHHVARLIDARTTPNLTAVFD